MIIHTINDLSNTKIIDFLKRGLEETIRLENGLENYHPDFSDNNANLFYILKQGRYKNGNYFIMEEDGKYAGSAGWNPYFYENELLALGLTRAFVPVQCRTKFYLANHLLPIVLDQSISYKKLWITCNDYNFTIYQTLARLQLGKSSTFNSVVPSIYKKFVPIGKKIVNFKEQYVAEYIRENAE